MKPALPVLLFVFWGCAAFTGRGQTQLLNKLRADVTASKDSAAQLQAILIFCDAWESFSPDTLHKYALLARQLAYLQKNRRADILVDYYVAAWLFQINKLDSAMAKIDVVITRYTSLFSYDEMYLKLYSLRGNILTRTSRINDLMSHNFDFLKLTETHNDTLGMARSTLGIANAKSRLKNYSDALSWYYRALALMHNPLYRRKLSFIYNNIAIVFYHLSQQDSAIYYVKLGLRYSREDENLTNLANALFVYGGLMAELGHLKEAEAGLEEAVKVRKQIGDIYYIINDMAQLAFFYANNNSPQKGIALCKEGLTLAEKNGQSYSNISGLYEVLAKNYQVAGDYEKYSEVLNKMLQLKDSTYKINSAQQIAELETKYEVQKKENTIIQQHLDLVKKNYLFYGAVLLSTIIFTVAIIVFRNYRKRQQLTMDRLMEDEKRNAAEAIKEAGEIERRRLAADLHDNLGAYAAAMISNIDHIRISHQDEQSNIALQELRHNSQSIVSQLTDTIWVLKKDALALTAISDRIKFFVQRIHPSYPSVMIDIKEEIVIEHVLLPMQTFHLFRIVQEAVNNALRHSGCRQIIVEIVSLDIWTVSIIDDGKGITDTAVDKGDHGLANMQKRAAEAGWQVVWEKNEPLGTRVIITPVSMVWPHITINQTE